MTEADLSLPSHDTVSWHHLSKEQVMKGILRQLHEGRIPSPVIFLIWNEIKRSLKADEDLARSYHDTCICDLALRYRSIQSIEASIDLGGMAHRNHPRKALLTKIKMLGASGFLYEYDQSNRSWEHASFRSKIRYINKTSELRFRDLKNQCKRNLRVVDVSGIEII